MTDFQIQYQIKAADYADANSLVCKSSPRWEMWCYWGAALLLIFLPFEYRQADESWRYPFLVVPFASFLIYVALLYVFPGWNARRYYSHANLSNASFTAYFSPQQVKVTGEHVAWVIQWAGFRRISESERLFVFYDGLTMYIFAKRYFAPEQISSLQQLIKENGTSFDAATA